MLLSHSLLSRAGKAELYKFKLILNKLKGFRGKNTEEVLHGGRGGTA